MNKSENGDMIIQFGEVLTSADSEVQILGYDLKADTYLIDLFSLDGNLIGPHRIIDGDFIRKHFRKRG
jgi:hypothetical protein